LRVRATVVAADRNRVSFQRVEWPHDAPPCLLPRAAAPDPVGKAILVACMGIDEIVEVDGAERPLVDSFLRRWRMPAGPAAIAVDTEHREAWIWSMFDRKLSRIALASPGPADASAPTRDPDAITAVPADTPLAADWSAGRRLFHTPLAFDGRACASCHPDARNDGLTWSSPAGPLQTPMLVERLAGTEPYGWLGDSPTLPKHIGQTLQRLRARALTEPEIALLAAYVMQAKTFFASRLPTAEEARGKAIFQSTEAGCVQCHREGGRKGDGSRHDVGTGGWFDTPSLRFVGATAPYGHDGRYATLRELLVKTDGKMGSARHLREPDLLALIAYLRSI
jgi:mono/diheme cytochrome c family protein